MLQNEYIYILVNDKGLKYYNIPSKNSSLDGKNFLASSEKPCKTVAYFLSSSPYSPRVTSPTDFILE